MHTKKVTVLVTGVGSPGGVTIVKALRQSSLAIRLISTDMNPLSAGFFLSDEAYIVPPASDPAYMDKLVSLCEDEKIDIAFIGSEPELRFLTNHLDVVENYTRTCFVISAPEIMTACMDKWQMTELLTRHGFLCPETTLASDEHGVKALVNKFGFPLFLKPRRASGSKGTVLVRNQHELKFFQQYLEDAVVQEWLPEEKEEYTVGIYVDRKGRVVGSIVSKRELTAGLTYRAIFADYPEISDYCEKVAGKLRPLGPCNFQLRRHKGCLSIFEINPRCSSTTIMRAVMGFNEPEMAIRDLIFQEELEQPQVKLGIVLRYWDEVYLNHTALELPASGYGRLRRPTASIIQCPTIESQGKSSAKPLQ